MWGTDRRLTAAAEIVDVARIEVPADRGRWTGGPADVELRERIVDGGLNEPIILERGTGETQRLVAGSRRLGAWASAPTLRDKRIPAVIVGSDVAAEVRRRGDLAERDLVESLPPLDKAVLARASLEAATRRSGWKRPVAKGLGLTVDRLDNLLRVVDRPELVGRVKERRLTVGAAIALASLPPDELAGRLETLDAARKRASVREVEELVASWTGRSRRLDLTLDARSTRLGPVIERLVASQRSADVRVEARWSPSRRTPLILLQLHYWAPDEARVQVAIREAEALAGAPRSPRPKRRPTRLG